MRNRCAGAGPAQKRLFCSESLLSRECIGPVSGGVSGGRRASTHGTVRRRYGLVGRLSHHAALARSLNSPRRRTPCLRRMARHETRPCRPAPRRQPGRVPCVQRDARRTGLACGNGDIALQSRRWLGRVRLASNCTGGSQSTSEKGPSFSRGHGSASSPRSMRPRIPTMRLDGGPCSADRSKNYSRPSPQTRTMRRPCGRPRRSRSS